MAYFFGEPKTIRNGIPRIDLDILTGVFHFGYLDIHMKMHFWCFRNLTKILFSRSSRGQNNPHKLLDSSQVAWPVQAQMSFDRFSLLIEANAGDNVECRWLVVPRFLAYLHRFTSYYIHVYIYICVCVHAMQNGSHVPNSGFSKSQPFNHPTFTQGYQWLAPIPPGPFLIGTAFGDHHILPAELKKKRRTPSHPNNWQLVIVPIK